MLLFMEEEKKKSLSTCFLDVGRLMENKCRKKKVHNLSVSLMTNFSNMEDCVCLSGKHLTVLARARNTPRQILKVTNYRMRQKLKVRMKQSVPVRKYLF